MGVSIGIEGSTADTATLGGYVYIDGIPHILTVHHLFNNDDTGEIFEPGTIITQPFLQELNERAVMWDRLRSSQDCFHLECVKKAFEDLKVCLPEFPFGKLERSSGYRNRLSRDGSSRVEMDWAICKVDDARVGSNTSPCENHFCHDISPVTPGGAVFAIGCTSGQQSGNINGSKSYLLLRNPDGSVRESEEWAVLRPQSQGEDTWLTHGIGVDGDSGAWILEHGSDKLVGQVWGRDFQDEDGNDEIGEVITYFTPIQDIFDDILQTTGAIEISISSSGKSNKEEEEEEDGKGKNKRKESPIRDSSLHNSRKLGKTSSTQENPNSGGSTTFMLAVDESTPTCNLCVDLKRCRCLMVCIFGTLMRPAAKKNICGICHKPVNKIGSQVVSSPPKEARRTRMMVMVGTGSEHWNPSISRAEEDISQYQLDISRLLAERDERRGTWA